MYIGKGQFARDIAARLNMISIKPAIESRRGERMWPMTHNLITARFIKWRHRI